MSEIIFENVNSITATKQEGVLIFDLHVTMNGEPRDVTFRIFSN